MQQRHVPFFFIYNSKLHLFDSRIKANGKTTSFAEPPSVLQTIPHKLPSAPKFLTTSVGPTHSFQETPSTAHLLHQFLAHYFYLIPINSNKKFSEKQTSLFKRRPSQPFNPCTKIIGSKNRSLDCFQTSLANANPHITCSASHFL